MGTLAKHLTLMLRLERLHAIPYHPQTNGVLERLHATLETLLGKAHVSEIDLAT